MSSDHKRAIRVVKKADTPKLKENPKLGEVRLTRWSKISVVEIRKQWMTDHEECLKAGREQAERFFRTKKNARSNRLEKPGILRPQD